jgi:hypothetical protein
LKSDSLAWIRAGIGKFWPDLPEEDVKNAFDRALVNFQRGDGVSLRVSLQNEVNKILTLTPVAHGDIPAKNPCEVSYGALK